MGSFKQYHLSTVKILVSNSQEVNLDLVTTLFLESLITTNCIAIPNMIVINQVHDSTHDCTSHTMHISIPESCWLRNSGTLHKRLCVTFLKC